MLQYSRYNSKLEICVDLKEYFQKHIIDPTEFAARAEISVSTLYNALRKRPLSRRTRISIHKITNGEVSIHELCQNVINRSGKIPGARRGRPKKARPEIDSID